MAGNAGFADAALSKRLYKFGNQIFKLLPMREEGQDCEKFMQTLVVEAVGLGELMPESDEAVALACKLRGLEELSDGMDFMDYRRTVFECCSLVSKIRGSLDVD